MRYDLVIRGGEVIDPSTSGLRRLDVAVSRGRIAAVEPAIPDSAAVEVIDGRGRVVAPGLVDIHTHIYRGATFFGVAHDAIAWRTGVTTWVDAGSAGAFSLPGFREFIATTAATRVHAFLNISSIGLVADTGEMTDLRHGNVDLAIRSIEENGELVVGVKVRISNRVVGANGIEPLRLARHVADACRVPVMVHIGHGPPTLNDILDLLRAGDIVTHCCTGASMRLLNERGRLHDAVRRARYSGVLFDVGHGSSSFLFNVAEALLEQGFRPDIISSDLHQRNVYGPVFDLPTCMTKMMLMGMSLGDVIRATTMNPSSALGLDTGSLRVGRSADIAMFKITKGRFPYYDGSLDVRWGNERIENVLTLRAGRRLSPVLLPEPAPWIELTGSQREAVLAATERARSGVSFELDSPEDFQVGPTVVQPLSD